SDKLRRGLQLAEKRLLEKNARNGKLLSQGTPDGKVIYVSATVLLERLQEKEKEERRLARKLRAEKAEKRPKATTKSTGRKIGRYDDNMILLQKYESVSSASVAVGISPKSIRDAASGRQKHAAGYVWRYLDSNQNEGDSI
ncbi:MAG: hypothetical protein EGR23_11675, partial [Holdemanella biformis]|nr:hypothetical protein [Holdemanella biformis]